MTLTTRLLWFYLGSLAVLLAGFSTAVYVLAHNHLYRQADERLEAALNTLGAAIEVGADGVEWDPNERTLHLAAGPDAIAWVVTDDRGRTVATSDQTGSVELVAVRGEAGRFNWHGETWQAGRRTFAADPTRPTIHDDKSADPADVKYPALTVSAAVPLEPVRATLQQLLAVLVGTSLGVLIVAAVAGRFVCRRALRPVRRMADDARAIDPAEPDRRIAAPTGGDELTDLGVAFNGLLDRLHESAERHRRFAGDASHQLRTPLAALLGQIEVALRRERSADDYREVLATAQAKATHLQRIVEALLFLTRASSEAAIPQREQVDLATWLPTHLQQWAGHPRWADIHVTGIERPVPVVTHPVLLGEVMNVLIDNACRYSPAGSPIAVSLSEAGGSARIEVADRGPGIAAADLPQVFTPFFRTTDALKANRQGVGLGLSIARRLVEALGGELRVTSEVGVGSRFVVTLPTHDRGRSAP